jgi:hypothetical protein
MYRSGYIVGKYISVEMHIERTKVNYYEALLLSSRDGMKVKMIINLLSSIIYQ